MSDLPKGYRWATAEETEAYIRNNPQRVPGAIVVLLTVDNTGKPYTHGEADLAVPYSTKSRPNSNYILQVMRDSFGDGDPWGTAMAWGFAVAETLTVVGAEVPAEMEYLPSPFVQAESPETYNPESYEDEVVWEYLGFDTGLTLSRVEDVQFAGKCIARYVDWCKAAGLDY